MSNLIYRIYFVFNNTASPEIYTYGHALSLHDALPISYVDPHRTHTEAAMSADPACPAPAAPSPRWPSIPLDTNDPLRDTAIRLAGEIGRAHVCTPVTNSHLVCRLLLEKKKEL